MLRPGFGIQIGYTWLVSPTMVNELKVSTAWNGQRIPPVGDDVEACDLWICVYANSMLVAGRFENGIPNTTLAGFASFQGPAASSAVTDDGHLGEPTTCRGYAARIRSRPASS